MSRRKMLMGSLATAATAYVATSFVALAGDKGMKYGKGSTGLIGFSPVTLESTSHESFGQAIGVSGQAAGASFDPSTTSA